MAINFIVSKDSTNDILQHQLGKIVIDGYQYTAITSRNYKQNNNLCTENAENGMEIADHIYTTPDTITYTVVVSKINKDEYYRLYNIYKSKAVVPIELGISTKSPKMYILSKFNVKDEYFDTLSIDVEFNEILYGDVYSIEPIDIRFQLFPITNGEDKDISSPSVGQTVSTNEYTSGEIPNDETYETYISDVLPQKISEASGYDRFLPTITQFNEMKFLTHANNDLNIYPNNQYIKQRIESFSSYSDITI